MKGDLQSPSLDEAALLVVDLQPDFMPGGALAVPGADEIIRPIREIMESSLFKVMVATQDWHPREHISFATNHPGRTPMNVIEVYGHEQILWPDHCIQGSPGAALHTALPWERASAIIRKAMDPSTDSYSAFRNNWNPSGKRPSTGLAGYLKDCGVESLFICGLARDFCVKWSAEDAADEGFRVCVLWDLTRSINPCSDQPIRDDFTARGITTMILNELSSRRCSWL
jgi:nicotinamidase/pyrazinamidase